MTDQSDELLGYIQSQIEELNTIHAQAEKALNAVQGKDHVTKWLETSYFVGDVFDELADEVDMCRRHLKKLAKEIQTSGIP